eukprot:Skav224347  [mRNA]  locus=scaffold2411:215349:220261:- [translate_table: standard]
MLDVVPWPRGTDRADFVRSLKAAKLRPDVRTYNPMITACAESQGWEEAVMILDEMAANEVAPDIKSRLLICLLGPPRSQPALGRLCVDGLVAGGAEPLRSVAASGSCDQHGDGEARLRGCPKRLPPRGLLLVPDRNTCIGACASASSWPQAFHLLDQLEQVGPAPDVISYNTVGLGRARGSVDVSSSGGFLCLTVLGFICYGWAGSRLLADRKQKRTCRRQPTNQS